MASSVFFAIQDAIGYARNESGLVGNFRLNSPATAERIRMACGDKFTQQVLNFIFILYFASFARLVFVSGFSTFLRYQV